MQVKSKSFPLKSGSCHIYPDAIHIRNKGLTASLGRLFAKMGFERYIVFYSLLFLGFGISLLIAISIQNYFLVLFFAISGLFSLRMLWVNRQLSFAAQIDKKQIDYIEYLQAVPGERRASFIIVYQSGKHTLKRKLLLPTQKGEMIAQSAFFMVKDTGLLKTQE